MKIKIVYWFQGVGLMATFLVIFIQINKPEYWLKNLNENTTPSVWFYIIFYISKFSEEKKLSLFLLHLN